MNIVDQQTYFDMATEPKGYLTYGIRCETESLTVPLATNHPIHTQHRR